MLPNNNHVVLKIAAAIALVLCLSITANAANPMLRQLAADRAAVPSVESASAKDFMSGNLDGVNVDEIMSQMTDEQVRRLLIEKLRAEALKSTGPVDKPREVGALSRFILWVQNGILRLRERVEFLLSGAIAAPQNLPDTVADMTGGKGFRPFLVGLLRLALIFLAAWLVNWMFRRSTTVMRQRIETTPDGSGWRVKVARLALRSLLDLVSIGIFILVTLIIYFTFFEDTPGRRSFLLTYLTALSLVGLLRLLSRFILAPNAPALRYLPMDGETAVYLHRWLMRIAIVGIFGWLTSGMLRMHTMSEGLHFLLVVLVGLVIAVMIVQMILQNRQRVAEMLREDTPETSLRFQSAGVWHLLAVGYVFLFWAFWVFSLLLLGDRATLAGVATILAVPLFFLFDWVAGQLLRTALGTADAKGKEADSEKEQPEEPTETEAPNETAAGGGWRMNRSYSLFRRGFRIAIATFLLFWILEVWGIELPIAISVTNSILRILLTVVLFYVAWEMINAFIERKLKTMKSGPEGGGAGGNRFQTLVQLSRKFIIVVLITMVSLIVLSSLGIEIGPLLAGAGVVGLAIGFGSQALVKDIVAGVFFLMDDAFRIGDYIELGTAKGVVERISIRSLQLRHHRGMVYTIPFGGLKEVKNLTRDWVIMKLEFRVPFDTDVDKVRKIVKKMNKRISAHEEMGPCLLGKIKSQGVKEYDDSAMVMRIKFKTKPGEQFQIRKEVYKQLREDFAKAGIEFATRKVMVQMPPELEANEGAKTAAAAAAQAAIDAQEANAAAKKPM